MEDWRTRLAAAMDPGLAREIDVFEQQMELRRQGKVDEKVFAETRLRRGVYGQRYDNGRRDDGTGGKPLSYPCGALTKGPETVWDAPGMMRIKLPLGRLTPTQMETLADVAEEHSDGVIHITTRQDVQLHFVHIDDTPTLMRRLAAVGVTTREACGNSVRNVTTCPLAGVCRDEAFDVTAAAEATAAFLLGHPDTQDFGRKFKVAFSGCSQRACGLVSFHDLGCVARTRPGPDGVALRGFEVWVGGGLGAVPHRAVLYADFLPEAELLPLAQALSRVFARLGEKRNRARARLKFVVARLGIDEFRRLVNEERAGLHPDPRHDSWVGRPGRRPPAPGDGAARPGVAPLPGHDGWRRTNVAPQRQPGFSVVTVALPLGDLTSVQMRRLADLAAPYGADCVRTSAEQDIVLRWVPDADLPALHRDLSALGLADEGAGGISDVTACPGTDTCKLGIASSRGLAGELRRRLKARPDALDPGVEALRIKASGCFNSCGQHHVADLGFYGVSRNVGGYTVPHFQVVLGGRWVDNGGAFGLGVAAVPSRRIPEVVELLTAAWTKERADGQSFQDWIAGLGRAEVRARLEPLMAVPAYAEDPSLYTDWADARVFSLGDLGQGECAGEVVSVADFGLAEAERLQFDAQLRSERGDHAAAGDVALAAMLEAAKALLKVQDPDVQDGPDWIVEEFRRRLVEPGLFRDPYPGARFAQYLFRRHAEAERARDAEDARRHLEEAQLFIEAAHDCRTRLAAGAP